MSLDRWFKEKWVDVKTGKPCGRKKGESRGYPACRPSKRISSKTPKTTSEMSAKEKARFKREKVRFGLILILVGFMNTKLKVGYVLEIGLNNESYKMVQRKVGRC